MLYCRNGILGVQLKQLASAAISCLSPRLSTMGPSTMKAVREVVTLIQAEYRVRAFRRSRETDSSDQYSLFPVKDAPLKSGPGNDITTCHIGREHKKIFPFLTLHLWGWKYLNLVENLKLIL